MYRSSQLTILKMVCFFFALSWTTHVAVAQGLKGQLDPNKRELPSMPSTPTVSVKVPHHVLGTLKNPHNCGTNSTVSLSESWYVASDTRRPPTLVPAGNTLAGNFQVRTIGSAQIDPTTGNFDVQWMEVNALDRMPWILARHAQTGQPIIAYRVLMLGVVGSVPVSSGTGIVAGTPSPEPLITFIGNETSKNVRFISVTCRGQG